VLILSYQKHRISKVSADNIRNDLRGQVYSDHDLLLRGLQRTDCCKTDDADILGIQDRRAEARDLPLVGHGGPIHMPPRVSKTLHVDAELQIQAP
jgi:hypothetical protein